MLCEADVPVNQGATIIEAARKLGIAEQTYYRWRKEHGGTRVDQAIGMHSPGNIRELENVIERAVVFCDGDIIKTADLPVFLKEKTEEDLAASDLALTEKVEKLEIMEIKRALRENNGIKSRAARALGITERMLGYKMKIYDLSSK
jgi:transcriptional regulator with PAS, ATPase and Fis domain